MFTEPAPKAEIWPHPWMTDAQVSACDAVLVGWNFGSESGITMEDLSETPTKEPPFSEAISEAEEHTTFPSPDIHKGKWHGRLRKQKEPPRSSRLIAKTYGEALKRRRKRVKCKEGDEA
ncbi:hypothetical protein B0H14DRAFT_2619340 [Mycena olivaceomarginata]|nr:hypothetical protein B0H14DRAFT_2619340 [Mycena olivaceomarginata]